MHYPRRGGFSSTRLFCRARLSPSSVVQRQCFSYTSPASSTNKSSTQIEELLAQPTWSVASLLPNEQTAALSPRIDPKQLHHLLRLSALPPPKDQAEEDKMLKTLSSQLHFVKEIQHVDTAGVEPLQSIRDETTAGRQEAEIGIEALKDALSREEVVGQFHKRIRRRKMQSRDAQGGQWDVLGNAEKKVGRYFVVEGGKD